MAPGAPVSSEKEKPLHVAMLPWLAMGHIYPYFEVAKILAQNGHFVSFINTPKNIDRMPKAPKSLQPFIKLIRLPLPPVDYLPQGVESTMDLENSVQTPPQLRFHFLRMVFDGLQDAVGEVLKASKPDWVFCDLAGWLAPLAKSLNIRCAHYSVMPVWNEYFLTELIKDKKDSNFSDIQKLCALPNGLPFHTTIHLKPHEIVRISGFLEHDVNGETTPFDIFKENSGRDMIIVRSSRELEGEWLDYVADTHKIPVVPVGFIPPSMQIRDAEEEDNNNHDWVKIKAWLDTQEPSSVLYIALGSELKVSQQDLTELACGIELSGVPFFWALRNLKEGSFELPQGFEDRTKDRGIIWKTWAPQLKILAHGAIGGCICHCGASSVIEMLNFGHVLVTLPYLFDQALVSRVLGEKKVAIEVPRNEQDGSFTRNSVAQALKLAMVDEEGKTYRENAKEMGKVFSSEELHNHYIQEFIAALQKYRPPSNKN